jgi:hypothetical protein
LHGIDLLRLVPVDSISSRRARRLATEPRSSGTRKAVTTFSHRLTPLAAMYGPPVAQAPDESLEERSPVQRRFKVDGRVDSGMSLQDIYC